MVPPRKPFMFNRDERHKDINSMKPFNMQETLESIQVSLAKIEKSLCSELYSVKTKEEADQLFAHLSELLSQGQGLEFIIRRV